MKLDVSLKLDDTYIYVTLYSDKYSISELFVFDRYKFFDIYCDSDHITDFDKLTGDLVDTIISIQDIPCLKQELIDDATINVFSNIIKHINL